MRTLDHESLPAITGGIIVPLGGPLPPPRRRRPQYSPGGGTGGESPPPPRPFPVDIDYV